MPTFIRRFILNLYENYHTARVRKLLKINDNFFARAQRNVKPRILFYHISGLSFGGTEKFLQILAKHINHQKYDVYFMYSPKPRQNSNLIRLDERLTYFKDLPINLITFDFLYLEDKYPYFIKGMSPSIFEIIKKYNIDLLVTAGSGYSEFPINLIRNIPIIMLNIFGSPSVQKNIIHHICISHTVAVKVSRVVPKEKLKVMYILSEGPTKNSQKLGFDLRRKLKIKDNEIVFGRIGRASDSIFDSIGIYAFQKVVREKPWIHYLIMAPPPMLKKIVEDEKILNVHFLNPSAKEEDVWTFHQAIDVMAHFRKDGESFGLNIAEAMLCGRPIITHKSHIWNAHLEYLEESFSKVAEIGDVEQYAKYIRFFADDRDKKIIKKMGELARQKAEPLFLIKNNIEQFEKWLDETLKNIK